MKEEPIIRKMKIELFGVEAIILQEIADKSVRRNSVALTYAFCISSSEDIDFGKTNKAIVARWGLTTLDYIKKKAWKIVEGRC